jgi:hypothetical protein
MIIIKRKRKRKKHVVSKKNKSKAMSSALNHTLQVCDTQDFVEYSRAAKQVLESALNVTMVKANFPLYPIFDDALTVKDAAAASNEEEEQQRKKNGGGTTASINGKNNNPNNRGLLHCLLDQYSNTSTLTTRNFPLSKLNLDSGFPFLIQRIVDAPSMHCITTLGTNSQTEFVSDPVETITIEVLPNPRFFGLCASTKTTSGISNNNTAGIILVQNRDEIPQLMVKQVRLVHTPVLNSYTWQNLLRSYEQFLAARARKFNYNSMNNDNNNNFNSNNNNNNNNNNENGNNENNAFVDYDQSIEFKYQRQRLAQYLTYPDDQVEELLLDDKVNQLPVEGNTLVMNLKQSRKKYFDIHNSAYVIALIHSLLSIMVVKKWILHFPVLYSSFVGFDKLFFQNSVSYPVLCPLKQTLLCDLTYSFKDWLLAQPNHSVRARDMLAILFQVTFALDYGQRSLSLVLHNFHFAQLGYTSFQKPDNSPYNYMLYRWQKQYYLVPVQGRLMKITQFQTATIRVNGQQFSANAEYHQKHHHHHSSHNHHHHSVVKTEHDNFNVDLLRFGATLLPTLLQKVDPRNEPHLYRELLIMVKSWTLSAYHDVLPSSCNSGNNNSVNNSDSAHHNHNKTTIDSVPLRTVLQDIDECLRSEDNPNDAAQVCSWKPVHIASHTALPYSLPRRQPMFFDSFRIPSEQVKPTDFVITMYDDDDVPLESNSPSGSALPVNVNKTEELKRLEERLLLMESTFSSLLA